jgi:hypothetical protein
LDIVELMALGFLATPNPTGRPTSDVVLPWMNGLHLTRRYAPRWIIDFPIGMQQADAAGYAEPFGYAEREVKPLRVNHREAVQAKYWWRQARPCPELRDLTRSLARYCVTPRVAKHRIIAWVDSVVVPDCQLVAIARDDDYFFGVLHSRFHEVWALAQGTQLREKESGFRYTPTTCFETFPFPLPNELQSPEPTPVKPPPKSEKPPEPDRFYAENLAAKNYFMGKEEPPPYGSRGRHEEANPSPSSLGTPPAPPEHRAAIAAAAKALNELRERWLNPPEWTVERSLEFPGSADGPWSRYVADPDQNGIGTVRYPRLEPRDGDYAAKLEQRTLTNLSTMNVPLGLTSPTRSSMLRWPPPMAGRRI